jgi:hypothetical protein
MTWSFPVDCWSLFQGVCPLINGLEIVLTIPSPSPRPLPQVGGEGKGEGGSWVSIRL